MLLTPQSLATLEDLNPPRIDGIQVYDACARIEIVGKSHSCMVACADAAPQPAPGLQWRVRGDEPDDKYC